MELIVQKCTELGVSAIIPVSSARCVVVPGKDYDKKRERYNRVALEAAKQSRRAMVPQVLPLIELKKIDVQSFDLFLVAYEDEDTVSLKQALRAANAPASIALLIGPEGGLEEGEVSAAGESGRCERFSRQAHSPHGDRRHGDARADALRGRAMMKRTFFLRLERLEVEK